MLRSRFPRTRKIAAALAAGCSVVARPACEAPGPCFAIAQALVDAGAPPRVITTITGPASKLAACLIASPVIRKVSLTGLVAVGKQVLMQCAVGVKRVVARSIVVGHGLKDGVTMGPMIRRNGLEGALALVEDAVKRGARLLAGGGRPAHLNKGHFLEPTVLADVSDEALIMNEEPFAPIAPIAPFADEDDAIRRANALPFGPAAYVFTNDAEPGTRTAEKLESGMVGINEVLLATAEAPFGGIKESGFGREGRALGIKDYLEPKYIRQKLIPTK